MNNLLSLDIETSGIDRNKHAVLSIGAVDHRSKKDFYVEIQYKDLVVSPEAMKINGFNLIENPTNNSVRCTKDIAFRRFKNFLNNCVVDNDRLTPSSFCKKDPDIKFYPVGFNVGSFDMAFLLNNDEPDFMDFQLKDMFSYRSVELNSLIMLIAIKENKELREVKEEMNVLAKQRFSESLISANCYGEHHALYDAWFNFFSLEVIKERLL